MLSPAEKSQLRKLLSARTADHENTNGANGGGVGRSAHHALTTTVTGFTDEKGFTEYLIRTVYRNQEYLVAQRYSAFLALHEGPLAMHDNLCFPFPVGKALIVLPHMKQERVSGLDAYLTHIREALDGAAPPRELLEFLGVPPALGLHSGKYG